MKPDRFEMRTYGSVKYEPGFQAKKPQRIDALAEMVEVDGLIVPVGLLLKEKLSPFVGKKVIISVEVIGE